VQSRFGLHPVACEISDGIYRQGEKVSAEFARERAKGRTTPTEILKREIGIVMVLPKIVQ
jgi:hypothetical protein